jgi:hypothetical protein
MKAASVVSRRSPICSTCKRSWTLSSTANRHRGQSQSSTIACGHSGSPIISFAECRSDTLGRAAARIIAQQAAKTVDGLSSPWVEAAVAVAVALNGRKPRVTGVAPAVELAQLTRALSRVGLVLILEPAEPDHAPAALVRALEWIAQNAPVAVVAIFPQLPANDPPWDRLLYFARQIVLEPGDFQPDPRAVRPTAWLAPWRGLPHPLSDIEQRLAKMLAGDAELAPLFASTRSLRRCAGRSLGLISSGWKDG